MPGPRISLNKLGEYLDANPSRRRKIVHDQQAPQTFIVTRYGDAREAIIDYLEGALKDAEQMMRVATRLREDKSGTEFARQDRAASADAIENFLDVSGTLDFDGLSIHGLDRSTSASVDIAGVSISIRPDVLLKDARDGRVVGAVKLHFAKTSPLSERSREYVATALRFYLEDAGYDHVDHKKCIVVDVSTEQSSHAPKSYARKMKDIEAACEEIAARWAS